jgi:hypothetical protein
MEVHNIFKHDIDRLVRSALVFFKIDNRGSFILVFFIQFFRQCVNIIFQHALAFTIKKKIVLGGDACSRSLIIIKSHNYMQMTLEGFSTT